MASLEDQLKAVKLKKSDKPMKDFSSAKTAGFMKEEEIKGNILLFFQSTPVYDVTELRRCRIYLLV